MRRISLVFVALVFAVISLSTVSFAADQYAYRAGQTYMRTTANSHMQCEAQCRGDAACRGWNFIKPNPRSRSGICEFNARQAQPVSSPVSISGEINTRIDQAVNRAAPIVNGNTVRVGAPMMPIRDVKRTVVRQPIRAPQMAGTRLNTPPNNMRNTPQRIVQKVPEEQIIRAPIPAGYRLLVPAREAGVLSQTANVRTVRKPLPQARLQPFTGPIQPRSMTRQQIYNEQMFAARKRAEAQANIQANARMQQAQYRAVLPPRAPQQFAPALQQVPQAPQISRAPQAARVQMQPMIPTAAPNQQSLYGSLYDDLTKNMTPVPRPQTAPDQMNNPDAPIATRRVIPAIPVQVSPYNYPTISGLAGG